jgi:hypothetical protein
MCHSGPGLRQYFSTGKQAFWHVRPALCFHGHSIKYVHFVNRDFSDNATSILAIFECTPALASTSSCAQTNAAEDAANSGVATSVAVEM